MKILNLTQHTATADQVAAGVVEPKDKKKIQEMLTFTEKPKVLSNSFSCPPPLIGILVVSVEIFYKRRMQGN